MKTLALTVLALAAFASFTVLLGASHDPQTAEVTPTPHEQPDAKPTPASIHDIPLPKRYATTFTNYLSLDRVQNHDQVIRLFANDTAMTGPGPDGKLPYGSVIVGEVYKARKDADGNVATSSLGRRIRGDLALIAVMQREPGWGEAFSPELRNDDWDFAAFKPDGSVAGKDINACRSCHAPLTEMNHVFSLEHLVDP